MKYVKATQAEGQTLAEIRAAAMKPSLMAVGLFDEERIRRRFLDTFIPDETIKLLVNGELIGFYALRHNADHLYLNHLYLKPAHQNKKYGRTVVEKLIKEAIALQLPLRLRSLKGSRSNDFYRNNGFIQTHEDEFDIYYQHQGS